MHRLLLALLLLGCGGSAKTVLSMRDIDCSACGTHAMDALERCDGVEKARFDRPAAELVVEYDPKTVDPVKLAAIAGKAAGVEVVVGGGKGRYAESDAWPEDADLQVIKDADATLVPVAGKVTIFDFYAEWCGPCRQVDASLRKAAAAGEPIAVRKIDIEDWDRPMAKVHLKGISELPYIKVHGPDGRLIDTIVGLDLGRLRTAIDVGKAALKRTPE